MPDEPICRKKIATPTLIFNFMSDRFDIWNNPSAHPSHRFSDVAEHLCLTLWFSCTDGRDTGTLATRVTPVTPVAVPTQAFKCIFDRAPARCLGSRPIWCAATDRWHPVSQRAADRAVMVPLRESWSRSWGSYSTTVTEVVRSKYRAHDLPRPLINRGEGANLSPPPHSFLPPCLSSFSRTQSAEPAAAARARARRRAAGRQRRARTHRRAAARR